MAIKRLLDSAEAAAELVENTDVFIFDLDGVVWDGKLTIHGSASTINYLRLIGKKIYVCTNNSLISREYIQNQFASFGCDLKLDEIYSSSFIVAEYLRSNIRSGNILTLGGETLVKEVAQAIKDTCSDAECIHADSFLNQIMTPQEVPKLDLEKNISRIVMGFDLNINYTKLSYLTMLLHNNPDIEFIVTNKDLIYPAGGRKLLGTGAIIAAVEISTGAKAHVVGKPNGFVVDRIAQLTGVPREKICMVGDNLDTDILFGRQNGINALLVETGVHTVDDAMKRPLHERPNFVAEALKILQVGGELSEPVARN